MSLHSRPGSSSSDWRIFCDQVTIGVVLNHVPCRIPPVVKKLTAKDVATYSPHALVPLLAEPVMSQLEGIEIVDFKGTVVNVSSFGSIEEDLVVVYEFWALVDVSKEGNVVFAPGGSSVGDEAAGYEVDVARVPIQLGVPVNDAESIMAELN